VDALPDIERTSILCREERVIDPSWSRRMSRDLLGVDPIELDGGHSAVPLAAGGAGERAGATRLTPRASLRDWQG